LIAVTTVRRRWGLVIHLGQRRRLMLLLLLLLLRWGVAEVVLRLVRRGRPGRRRRRRRMKRWWRQVPVPWLLRRRLAVRVHRRRRWEAPLRRRVRPVGHRALGLPQTLTPQRTEPRCRGYLSRRRLLLQRSFWDRAGSSGDPLDLREEHTAVNRIRSSGGKRAWEESESWRRCARGSQK
jgi:hypothetical protein